LWIKYLSIILTIKINRIISTNIMRLEKTGTNTYPMFGFAFINP